MANDFYKTTDETILAGVVDRIYNDEIGGRENHYMDTNEKLPITEEELIHMAICDILKSKTILWTERGYGIEPKHIRFIGKERVSEIVEHRIKYRHQKEGKWMFED